MTNKKISKIENTKKSQKNIDENLIKSLSKEKRRITSTRMDILECLNDGQHQHTAKDIVIHLKSKYKHLNISTVYNNLKTLLKEGIIDVYPNYDSQNQRYEIVRSDLFHIHFREFNSGKEIQEEINENIFNEINKVVSKHGYKIHNLKIEILVKNEGK